VAAASGRPGSGSERANGGKEAMIRNNLRDFSLGFVTSIEEESVNTLYAQPNQKTVP
jgi:hypothetical protein